ncbi:MAG: GNAT family N-acetyltransferase [Reichenbachiella sp.]|uniref:GNAT family N-acetyltransferase n=1 Tax=Reichenbachiella sp. TaxID=2184521 RepID=UPI0032677F31
MITYKIEKDLKVSEFKDVLIRSTLGERRPIESSGRLKKMLGNGNLIATARRNGMLIGIARSLTDFSFCTYLSDLAVDEAFQGMGIGKELIRLTKLAAPEARLILHAAPDAAAYYPKIGMRTLAPCYSLANDEDLL